MPTLAMMLPTHQPHPLLAVFSFVRNPWARALSSWHHIHKYGLHPPCHDSLTKFAALPSAYGAKCLGERTCCKRRFGWLLEHIEPQATCLFDDQGRPAVDFLGRVEHLDEDMQVGEGTGGARGGGRALQSAQPLLCLAPKRLMIAPKRRSWSS
jgi:hypothetical protein